MKRKEKFTVGMFFIYLILTVWALTTIYPLVWVLQNSFKDRKHILSNSFSLPLGDLFTLANYEKAINKFNILTAYRNSLILSCTVCISVIVIAGMAAYALVRYKFKGSSLLNSLVIAAMMFPVFCTIIPVFRMERTWGIAGTNSVPMALLSCILPQIAGNLAFAIVVLSGYIKGLPVELEEAAYMEGAKAGQIFFKIIVPLTKPSFATVGIFSFLWSYNDLFTQSFFLRLPKQRSITYLLNEISGKQGTDYGLMAASVCMIVVPLLIVYVCLQKYIIKGMTAGAVKG